jgi:hypothetical protein
LNLDPQTISVLTYVVGAIARGVITASEAHRKIKEGKVLEMMAEIALILDKDPASIGVETDVTGEVPSLPPMPPYGEIYSHFEEIPMRLYTNGDLIFALLNGSFAVYPAVGYPGAPKPPDGAVLYGRVANEGGN